MVRGTTSEYPDVPSRFPHIIWGNGCCSGIRPDRAPYQAPRTPSAQGALGRLRPFGPARTPRDGNGLYLFVQPSGTRSWFQRLVVRGRRRELGLGAVALVPLAEAREQALANRRLARSGGDPLTEKRRVQQMPTFADAARRVLEQKQGGWRGRWHAQNWIRSLERYAFPRIGRRPVCEVNTADVLEILTPIWHAKAETARAVRQRIRSVLEWAVPHHRALPHKEVASALATVRASGSAQAVGDAVLHGPAS